MILVPGEKLYVIERRAFPEDIQRHFLGEVIEATESNIRMRGYTWVYDFRRGQYIRRPEQRERIIHLGDRLIVNVIPPEADLEEVRYAVDAERGHVVTDGKTFTLEISEFTSPG